MKLLVDAKVSNATLVAYHTQPTLVWMKNVHFVNDETNQKSCLRLNRQLSANESRTYKHSYHSVKRIVVFMGVFHNRKALSVNLCHCHFSGHVNAIKGDTKK